MHKHQIRQRPRLICWLEPLLSISPSASFEKTLTARIPSLPLNEFRAIDSSPDKANLTRAASKINENLYASTALEARYLKNQKHSNDLATHPGGQSKKPRKRKLRNTWQRCIRTLTPLMTRTQSQKKLQCATNGGEKTNVITPRQKVHCVMLSRTTAKRG